MTNEQTDEEPRIQPARHGYMACARPSHGFRIAVIGATEEEARDRFATSLASWREAQKLPDPVREVLS